MLPTGYVPGPVSGCDVLRAIRADDEHAFFHGADPQIAVAGFVERHPRRVVHQCVPRSLTHAPWSQRRTSVTIPAPRCRLASRGPRPGRRPGPAAAVAIAPSPCRRNRSPPKRTAQTCPWPSAVKSEYCAPAKSLDKPGYCPSRKRRTRPSRLTAHRFPLVSSAKRSTGELRHREGTATG